MIEVEDRPLPPAIAEQLTQWQAQLDSIEDYHDKVEAALEAYRLRSRTKTFDEVRRILITMCRSLQRCGYCEDGPAHHVDHIWPKSWYPERTFVWRNLLYCCGLCNERKGSRFAILREDQLHELHRRKAQRRTPPPRGRGALIDPRRENPLDLIGVDVVDTCLVCPRANLDQASRARAMYTIDVLQLNRRDVLVESRRKARHDYEIRVGHYVSLGPDAAPSRREALLREFALVPHRMVWEEMKRCSRLIDGLHQRLQAAPELRLV